MADIQSATAEITRGKQIEDRNHSRAKIHQTSCIDWAGFNIQL